MNIVTGFIEFSTLRVAKPPFKFFFLKINEKCLKVVFKQFDKCLKIDFNHFRKQKKSKGGTLIIKKSKNFFFLKIIKKCLKVVFKQFESTLEEFFFRVWQKKHL